MLFATVCLAICLAGPLEAENLIVSGSQSSSLVYRLEQTVRPEPGVRNLRLSFVLPESFSSPTYVQKVLGEPEIRFSVPPASRSTRTDARGNRIVVAVWPTVSAPIVAEVRLNVATTVRLSPLDSRAPFPLNKPEHRLEPFLSPTRLVQSDAQALAKKSLELTRNAESQFDAVQRVLTFVVDHLHYVGDPERHDALFSLETGRGNCQNYAHLSAALMRAAGIPVRIVNGVTLKQPYDLDLPDSVVTLKMAQGRHAWIEVWFPDLGFVPFDPQSTEMFVSSRYVRVEVGKDNEETINDGLVRWSFDRSAPAEPELEERIFGEFWRDQAKLSATPTGYGPANLLLSPRVNTDFGKPPVQAIPTPAPAISADGLKNLVYGAPYLAGNLEFPRNVDFLSTRKASRTGKGREMALVRDFVVETAEYVTTQGRQFAQSFDLDRPLMLSRIGLALHWFGGDGQVWLDLYADDGGRPGERIAASEFLETGRLPGGVGYDWADFSFAEERLLLPPGRYWVGLGFTGSPIVNWFFTYGKPTSPWGGTRFRTLFDEGWRRSLSYEFIYRVSGMAADLPLN